MFAHFLDQNNDFHAILPLHFLKQLKKTFMSLNLFIVLCFYLITTHLGMFFMFFVVSMTTVCCFHDNCIKILYETTVTLPWACFMFISLWFSVLRLFSNCSPWNYWCRIKWSRNRFYCIVQIADILLTNKKFGHLLGANNNLLLLVVWSLGMV